MLSIDYLHSLYISYMTSSVLLGVHFLSIIEASDNNWDKIL